MEKNTEDQRSFERFTARFRVKIKDSRDDFGTKLFLRDASADGVKLTARHKVFLNDSLSLAVKLPDGQEPLVLNGKIVWVKTKGSSLLWDIGMQFHKVDFMNIQRLFKFAQQEAV